MTPLPAHASLIANASVWMESEAIEQLHRVASLEPCLRAVGMPDLHPGRGIPIGAAFLFAGSVLPDLVGGDAGCGVLVLVGHKDGPRGDALERRVLAAWDEPFLPEVDAEELVQVAWRFGPRALARVDGVPEALAELAQQFEDDEAPSGDLPPGPAHALQLGTVGGGNHFAEISRVDRIADKERARTLAFSKDAQVIMVHSGSRALGAALHARYAGANLSGDAIERYLSDLRGAIRYARTNRLLAGWRLARAAGLGTRARIASLFDIVHNAVERRQDNTFLHRKGAAPAERDQPTVVLGSRGAASWVMQGLGNDACLCCVAHGAGKRMGRSDAHAKLKNRYTRASLARTALGSRVICDDTSLMYEEHPDAYKPIEPVVESLEQAASAARVAALIPLITVKK
ncbi:MAG: RtcB family protein [Myxococcales bacterium]